MGGLDSTNLATLLLQQLSLMKHTHCNWIGKMHLLRCVFVEARMGWGGGYNRWIDILVLPRDNKFLWDFIIFHCFIVWAVALKKSNAKYGLTARQGNKVIKMQRKKCRRSAQLRESDREKMAWKQGLRRRQTPSKHSEAPENLWYAIITITIITTIILMVAIIIFFFPSAILTPPAEISLAIAGGSCCLHLLHLNSILHEKRKKNHQWTVSPSKRDTSYFHRRQ